MKIEEAIKHAEEVAKKQENNAKSYPRPDRSVRGSGKKYNAYLKCAEEHRQLAEWLKDYKRLLEQEPCEDCISRELALEKMADYVASGYADSVEDFEEYSKIICQAPPVTPAEKVGHWVWRKQYWNWVCSECDENPTRGTGHTPNNMNGYKYCPNCGAKMEVKDGH